MLNLETEEYDETFISSLRLINIRRRMKRLSKEEGVGLSDQVFDCLINSMKQTIIKDVKFLAQKVKMSFLKQGISRVEKMRKFMVVHKEKKFDELGEEIENSESSESSSESDESVDVEEV